MLLCYEVPAIVLAADARTEALARAARVPHFSLAAWREAAEEDTARREFESRKSALSFAVPRAGTSVGARRGPGTAFDPQRLLARTAATFNATDFDTRRATIARGWEAALRGRDVDVSRWLARLQTP